MSHSPETWPIAAALLQFPGTAPDGTPTQEASAQTWRHTFRQVAAVGFTNVDLTDSWVRPGDLTGNRLQELKDAATAERLEVPVLSIVRKSVIDPKSGKDNLAYVHRSIDTAGTLGFTTLSLGLHQQLTAEQHKRLWFWTAPGNGDPEDDKETWDLAVTRFREIGEHAAEEGLQVSLEMYEDTYLGTAASAVRLIEDIGLDNVGLNPDIGNLVRLHRSIEDWRAILDATLPYTNYWQVKNYFRDENPDTGTITSMPAPLELGFINYRDALNRALELGFNGVLCCEHYGGDGLGVSALNQRYLRELLAQSPAMAKEERP
ncbi:sugar phosphate isomerase/epimerase family protein [Haematomicrobium sanguinis]|uniref:sugar phosphate isomerase/epimerase family protein n=1 Tax=Haematomicrobium sanguinis TaxID=479106 RepID=UPI000690B7CC|nr:sugar phosphate isomerase/epimerase family protein [Haematomicrobium sanguinis]